MYTGWIIVGILVVFFVSAAFVCKKAEKDLGKDGDSYP